MQTNQAKLKELFKSINNQEKARDLFLDWCDHFVENEDELEPYVDFAIGQIDANAYDYLSVFMVENADDFEKWFDEILESDYFK